MNHALKKKMEEKVFRKIHNRRILSSVYLIWGKNLMEGWKEGLCILVWKLIWMGRNSILFQPYLVGCIYLSTSYFKKAINKLEYDKRGVDKAMTET